MTKEEAAQKFVSILTEQQCREMLANVLLCVLPGVFSELERLTTPDWVNKQTIQDTQRNAQQMQTILQSIGEYNKCRCAELRKEQR